MIENLANGAGPWSIATGIVVATLVSEDLTCIAVGLLLAAGQLEWFPALGACCAGIILGDFGVWLLARIVGSRLLKLRWLSRWLSADRVSELSQKLCRHGPRLAVTSRFLPGTRVPLFLAAGLIGACPYRFLAWAFTAALVWTPTLVISVAALGHSLPVWLLPVVGIAVAILLKLLPKIITLRSRQKLQARIAKIWRWEFWPAWLIYLPLVPWFLLLSLRHRSFTVWTAANPGIPAGGVVGESKAEILAKLPVEFTLPTQFIPPGVLEARIRQIQKLGWSYPLILKPDAGQRGAGVRKVDGDNVVTTYLAANPDAIIAQPYHVGPFEAGVFYYRMPGEDHGRIFSITDKVFPVVVGDGVSTLEDLIWMHPRYRLQAATFLARHSTIRHRVLAEDERFQLTAAGNHCQGTQFRDGAHLITPELELCFDRIASQFNGFYFGRFDVRYANVEEFRKGSNFAILELNGATSESTNLYDPSWSLLRAYITLFRQWAILFRIGAENRRHGHAATGLGELFHIIRDHYRSRTLNILSD